MLSLSAESKASDIKCNIAVKKKALRIRAVWRPHRESNPELALRRGLLYPFNYEVKMIWNFECSLTTSLSVYDMKVIKFY